jgi:uncharacterized repeat protein (TIGR01451 family)
MSTLIEEINTKKKKEETLVSKVFKKKEITKSSVVCKDVEGNTQNLKEGDKLLLLAVENVSGHITKDEVSNYAVKYKNNSDIAITNAIFKIKIPDGMSVISADGGKIDKGEIIFEKAKLKAGEEGIFKLRLQADEDITNGKNIILSVLSTYDVLDEKGETISDESSAYVISTATDKILKADAKTNDNFWSGWFFRTLLSAILLVILWILGRNIYKKVLHRKYHSQVLSAH